MQNLKSSNFEIMAISKNKKKQSLDPLSKAENVLRPFCCRKLVFGAGRSLHHPTFFLSPSISDCDNRILEISMPGIRHVYALRYWIISTTDLFTPLYSLYSLISLRQILPHYHVQLSIYLHSSLFCHTCRMVSHCHVF